MRLTSKLAHAEYVASATVRLKTGAITLLNSKGARDYFPAPFIMLPAGASFSFLITVKET